MEKGHNISSRHKRRLAQEKTEKDYLLLQLLSSGVTADLEPSLKRIKENRIENDSPNFSGNYNDTEEFLSDEVWHNSSEVVTDDEDFVNIEKEIQWLSFDSDESSDDTDDIMDVEHIDDEDKANASKHL